MNDERLERELRDALLRDDPGPLPQSLRARVAAIPDEVPPGGSPRRSRRSRLLAALAAAAAVMLVGAVIVVGIGVHTATIGPAPSRSPGPTAPASVYPGPAVVPAPPPGGVTDAGLVDPRHGWAVVNGRLMLTSDGGTTWTDRTPPLGAMTGENPLGVAFADPLHGWVAINESFTSPSDASYGRVDVWRTDDGGLTWEKVQLPPAVINRAGEVMGAVEFDFLDTTHGFAFITGGMATGYGGDLYWTADGGRTWSVDRPTPPGPGITGGIAFASANDGLVLGGAPGNRAFVTHDGGATWTRFSVPAPPGFDPSEALFHAAAFLDAQHGLLPVLYQADPGSVLRVYATADAGRTWTVASTLPANGDTQIAFLDRQRWITVGPTVQSTADGGRTWRKLTSAGPGAVSYLRFADPTTGWVQTGSTLMATSDGGRTWFALMPASSNSEPGVSPTPTVLPAPTAAVVPTGTWIGGFLWDRIDPQFGGAQPGPMTNVGSELVMATSPYGSVSPATAMPHPTFWHSSDGSSWQRLPDSPAFAGVQDTWVDVVLGLTSHGSVLIAVGMQQYADASTANAEAWISPDGGKTWARTSVANATQATMNFVYPVSGGFVAIGTDGYSFHAGMEGGTAIWTSPDGTRWTRLPQSEVPSRVSISSVAHGAGRYVAIGQMLPPGGSPTGPDVPIWTSTDGTHFTALTRTPGEPAGDVFVRQVIWTGSAFVTVGTGLTQGSYVWRSADGATWQQVDLPPTGPAGSQLRVEGVAQTPTGLLAVGELDDATGSGNGIVWESPDGRSWQEVGRPSDFQGIDLQSVAVIGAGHVVVDGRDTSQGGTLLWMLDPGTAGN